MQIATPVAQKPHNRWLGLREVKYNKGLKALQVRKAQSDLHEGTHGWTKSTPKTSQGCENLVRAPPHTHSGETSFSSLRTIAKRASGTWICLDI